MIGRFVFRRAQFLRQFPQRAESVGNEDRIFANSLPYEGRDGRRIVGNLAFDAMEATLKKQPDLPLFDGCDCVGAFKALGDVNRTRVICLLRISI